MKISTIAALLACVLMQCVTVSAGAAGVADSKKQDSPLSIGLSVKKIIRVKNEERKVDASRAEPGDVLEYRAVYKNIGDSTLSALSAILPLPEHTTLVGDSAYPANPEASTRSSKDKFSRIPRNGGVGSAGVDSAKDGNSGVASLSQYGALRWEISQLVPGESFIVGARVRVNHFISNDTSKASPAIQAGVSILQ